MLSKKRLYININFKKLKFDKLVIILLTFPMNSYKVNQEK